MTVIDHVAQKPCTIYNCGGGGVELDKLCVDCSVRSDKLRVYPTHTNIV